MGSSLYGVDIVYIRVYILREGVVVLHCNLYGYAAALRVEVDDMLGDWLTTVGPPFPALTYSLTQTHISVSVIIT